MPPSKSKSAVSRPYIWIPGQGPEREALDRLLELVPQRPAAAPGEAWLRGDERRYYHFLLAHPVSELPESELSHFLFDVVNGLYDLHQVKEEVAVWIQWLDYLWPRLLTIPLTSWSQRHVGEVLYTAVFTLLGARPAPYSNYRRDVLNTLGLLPMRPDLWDDENQCTTAHFRGKPRCTGIISAALYLSLTLLEEAEIQLWTQSLLAIESPFYRANILTWLTQACPMLAQEKSISKLCAENIPENIDWANSFLLAKSALIIPEGNVQTFICSVRQDLVFEKVLHWGDSIEADKEMAESLKAAGIVKRLVDEVLR